MNGYDAWHDGPATLAAPSTVDLYGPECLP